MNKQNTRERRDYLDIVKAITIFLVIIGHAAANLDNPPYRCVLYTFHMPLFFIVSGVVIRKHQTTKYDLKHYLKLLKNNFFALLVPYFIWALIFSKFNFKNVLNILYGSWESLTNAETLTSLWFLPCLFVARILMELVLNSSNNFKNINRHLYAFIFACISFTIGFLLPKIEQGYPFCLNISFVALGFMLLGYSFKELLNTLQERRMNNLYIVLCVSLATFIIGITRQNEIYLVLMCGGDYGNIFYFLLNALSGCAFILTLSCIIANIWEKTKDNKIRNFVIWLGQNTIGIFLLHKPFLRDVVIKLFNNFGLYESSFYVALIGALITLPIICIAVYIINKYIPELFGRFKKD